MIERIDNPPSLSPTAGRGWLDRPCSRGRGRFGRQSLTRIGVFLAVGMACLIASSAKPPAVNGQSAQTTDEQLEYNVKLAYLCNLGRYIDWPANVMPKGSDVLVIGILGPDPFQGTLDQIAAERKIQGRTVAVRHFASMKDYQPCHILFMSKAVPFDEQGAAVRDLRGKPVLLVGEIPGFAAQGGCVNFYRDGDNVRLEINPDAVQSQHLQASSKLLNLAKIVKQQ